MGKGLEISIVFILLACGVAAIEKRTYTVNGPTKHCKPCQLFSGSRVNRRCSADPKDHRVLKNDTFDVVSELLRQELRPISRSLAEEASNLRSYFGADVGFHPYSIQDLEDIEQSDISRHLKAGNPVERIIHNSYGRTVLLRAYLQLYLDILHDSDNLTEESATYVAHSTRVTNILGQIDHLLCKLYEYTFMFGVRKIKKKACHYYKVKTLDDFSAKADYLLAVIEIGSSSFNTTLADIQSLESSSVLDVCEYECKNNIRKLNCGEDKKQTRGGKRRKNKKKKGKGRKKDKKNRDEKTKGRRKNSKRRNRGKKNKKNRENKRRH